MNRNVRLFMAYRVISRLYFHLPVLFLLFWSLRTEYSTVTLLLATYSGASTLAADLAPRLSRVMTAMRLVLLGECMKSLGLVVLIIGTLPGEVSLPTLFLGQVIGGTGFALALAADGGLLRIAAPGADAKTLGHIQGRTQSMMFIATLVAGFIGGVLFDHEMHWAFYAGIAASVVSMIAVLFISAPPTPAAPASRPSGVTQPSTPPPPFTLSRNQTTWVGFYAITRGFALAPFIGLLPLHFALQNVDPYLFGIVLGLFTLGGFVVALWGSPVIAWLGPQAGVWITFSGIAGSLALFAASDRLQDWGIVDIFSTSLIGISLLGIAAGAIRSVVTTRMDLQHLTMPQRITVFARMERLFGYLSAFLLICFGELVERFSITVTFAFTALALLGVLAASAAWLVLTDSAEPSSAPQAR
ncbi:MFS transporter [Ideonella livida]|uniref:MFS transporter n=1 Tax=Ideonella livida TaxID=2707176 RepID=A0A7C9TNC6_9BURK|nr:MFS transporter [Ideonella livida]NDY92386.1 MFS transporter [Ideonella livida]